MKLWQVFLMVMLILAACAPDPRNKADAEAIRLRAIAEATATAQQTAQKQAEWELSQSERQKISEQFVASMAVLLRFVTIAAALGLTGIGIGALIAGVRVGQAMGAGAMVRARLVALDARTGQYPLLIAKAGDGYLTNANNNTTLALDKPNEVNQQMATEASDVQRSGVTSRNFSRLESGDVVKLFTGGQKYQLPYPVRNIVESEVEDDG